jgi:DNA-binding Lrp family transcriptional regulator
MHENVDLDELDRRMVTALQISPRASWHRVGQVVGVSASTAARRWEKLTEAGLAWFSCHPLRLPGVSAVLAVIEVDCVAARLSEVAAAIVEDSHVFNLSHVTGPHDLVMFAAFTDQVSLGRYLRFRLGCLDGVQSARADVVTALHMDGSRWRLDRLTPAHRAILLAGRPPTTVGQAVPGAADLALMTALSTDPRRSAADLTRDTGLTAASVRRHLTRIDAARFLAIRCEVARCVSGWPAVVNFWATIPPEQANRIANEIARLRETRFCASSLSGPDNLMFSVWLRTLADFQPFETMLATRIPELAIVARGMALWQMKLGGHITDPAGRHVRGVPMALWSEENAVAAERKLLDGMRRG